jgi:hypothetical protein
VQNKDDDTPVYFFGEMIFPSVFTDYANLRPLASAAELLAHDDTWPALYDLDRLAKNKVPVTTATYVDDMYVDYDLAQETASKIRNTEQYITNRYFHGGLRNDPGHILGELFKIAKRERD